MNALTAKLYSHDQYKKDEQANLIFELTNNTSQAVQVLKWNTPLEGLKSDCLVVKKDGKPVKYDGIMIKRGQPGPNDFVTLEPGQSVSNKFDVGEAYGISSPGKVKVDFKTDNLTVLNAQAGSLAVPLVLPKSQKKQNIETKPATFTIKGGSSIRLPVGELLRQSEQKITARAKKKVKPAAAGLLPCVFNGGTADQQSTVKTAHQNGYDLTLHVLTAMAKNADYKLWFGTYSKTRFNKVKKDYQKIRGDFENKQFTYDLTLQGCESGVYAYTYKGGSTIWLCDAFWAAPDLGTDSRAGTLVHEHSHASANTDDLAYGQDACKQLASSSPAKAINNADSHEYYAKG